MRTRFAPSPTGPLHLGHAFSALIAHDLAQQAGGTFLLRIEDIDRSRARPQWEAQICDDLHWLGLTWPEPVMRQSDRLPAYHAALQRLWDMGLLYPCHCTRRDIAEAASAPQEGAAPVAGPDGLVYPGTCRPDTPPRGAMPEGVTLRLDMARALAQTRRLAFVECGAGPKGETGLIALPPEDLLHKVGDVVLSRPAMATSYHLSVVIDDAAQEITEVIRGQDLFEATAIHVLLQALLDLPTPLYRHHRLIRDAHGKRLAKRDDARALSLYRAQGITPAGIRELVGL
ncbi:tRNA glutamyl-Q(34) synthetase GluQRS [Pseudooceanicola sp. CBS1P-1]|uniref:tRNA glutamyl-Q(34) synthetase GluQRS n=1 Tax=Pseudooceanicola albus TaxID=2692189 RepID=A0A6L7FYH3_9RHOB|nr:MULTISPECIES: tRNA glutamyl-Q(34) synthetase GluQRS [Pseudooceanicola]MBT9383195.1 tRNA glutamyl-Q(34) synthetase GluQRS [Pseudooceanicola endophyticus]MXN16482.1 tRNA glutamyl-Q(34) synthetase GluQRS [Pseudooceanicola albus]